MVNKEDLKGEYEVLMEFEQRKEKFALIIYKN